MNEKMKTLRKQLLRDDRSGYDVLDASQLAEMEAYCADYKAFLTNGKTERLSVRAAIARADDQNVLCFPVHSHGHMHDHFIVDELIPLGQHHVAVQREHPAELRSFKDIDALIIALPGVELPVHPDAVFHVRGVKL